MTGEGICISGKCTGCWACVNICPKSCISMQTGKLGHLYPEVDQSKCVNCKLCQKTCPENNEPKLISPIAAYASWHKKPDEYLSSTSGGAATAFAEKIIEDGGIVYGCESKTGLDISHSKVCSLNDIHRLKGSKYVQSNINDTYCQIKADLDNNIKVLFIGTPCQCAALKSFLRKEYENLYCVDLICHGVPSLKLLRSHVQKITSEEGVSVAFRKGNDMGLRVFDKDNRQIYYSNVWYSRYKDIYYNTFIDGLTYRDSCYSCRYARPERGTDVTIGDFWGLGDDLKHDNINGCSCVLPNTEKGLRLVLESNLENHQRSVDEAVNGNSQLRHPTKRSFKIKTFRFLNWCLPLKMAYYISELPDIIKVRFFIPIKNRLRK